MSENVLESFHQIKIPIRETTGKIRFKRLLDARVTQLFRWGVEEWEEEEEKEKEQQQQWRREMVIVGGGGNCFSFGTHFNADFFSFSLPF